MIFSSTTENTAIWVFLGAASVFFIGPRIVAGMKDTSPPKYKRTPGIAKLIGIDIVTITDPETITALSSGNDLARLDSVHTTPSTMPWIMRRYFKKGRMWNNSFGYFMPFRENQETTRSYLGAKFTPGSYDVSEYVNKAVDILLDKEKMSKKEAADNELNAAFVNAIGARFISSSLPQDVLKTGETQVKGVGDSFIPFKCPRSEKGIDFTCRFMRDKLNENGDVKAYNLPDNFPMDVAHSIFGGAVHGANALRTLAENPDKDVELIMCQRDGVTESVARVVVKDSSLGGILPSNNPARVGKTLIVLKIGPAARATGKLEFAFGSGTDMRRCCAEPAILEFMKSVQKELKNRMDAELVSETDGLLGK